MRLIFLLLPFTAQQNLKNFIYFFVINLRLSAYFAPLYIMMITKAYSEKKSQKKSIFSRVNIDKPILVAVRSKAQVYSSYMVGVAEGMEVRLLCFLFVYVAASTTLSEELYRVCASTVVIQKPQQCGALGSIWAAAPQKKNNNIIGTKRTTRLDIS